MVQVTFADAEVYAAWIGKQLRTEVEWERGAGGARRVLNWLGATFRTATAASMATSALRRLARSRAMALTWST